MTNTSEQDFAFIESWMLSNVRNCGYDRFDDLHIDRINPDWKPSNLWLENAFKAFRLALDAKTRHHLDFVVVLTFALQGGKEPRGRNFRTAEEMATELGPSPPALYLFNRGKEPWTDAGLQGGVGVGTIDVEKIDPADLGAQADTDQCYYLEFRQAELEEYSRTVLMAG